MPFEFSAGAIIYRKEKKRILYLLLKYGQGQWDFVEGKIGDEVRGEKALDTVVREAEEEAGITDLKFIEGFKQKLHYFFRKESESYYKTVTFFLAETKKKRINLSFEHTDYKWLEHEEALEQTTFKNAKDVLKKANTFLQKKKSGFFENFRFLI
jgi:8-oxo-dGTP pyrophosphatase MutT (NUDIX family)